MYTWTGEQEWEEAPQWLECQGVPQVLAGSRDLLKRARFRLRYAGFWSFWSFEKNPRLSLNSHPRLALAKFPQVLESTLVAAGLVLSRGWQSEIMNHDNDDDDDGGGGCVLFRPITGSHPHFRPIIGSPCAVQLGQSSPLSWLVCWSSRCQCDLKFEDGTQNNHPLVETWWLDGEVCGRNTGRLNVVVKTKNHQESFFNPKSTIMITISTLSTATTITTSTSFAIIIIKIPRNRSISVTGWHRFLFLLLWFPWPLVGLDCF